MFLHKIGGIELNHQHTEKQQVQSRALWVMAIMILAFNLRPAITSVGPLLTMIRDEIGLSNWSAGLITSLPLLAFALTSLFAPRIGQRFTNVVAVLFGLLFLVGGIIVRSVPLTLTLFAGTAFVGMGVGIMNVLLPAVIKEKFPDKTGTMTSVYTTSMKLFAATASGLSIPLALSLGLGWKLSLGVWAVMALIGIAIWVMVMKREKTHLQEQKSLENENNKQKSNTEKDEDAPISDGLTENKAKGTEDQSLTKNPQSEKNIWKSPLAWQVTVFMGTQSFMFYTIISWLPSMLQDQGFSVGAAGWMLSYVQFIGMPATFLAPIIAERLRNQSGFIIVIGVFITFAFSGMLIGGPQYVIIIWVTIIGLALGATISLSLALLGMRARTAVHAGKLSGMAQSIGYMLAAVGPILIGLLYDLSGTWKGPFIAVLVVCVIMTISGSGAGRNKYVLDH